MIRRNYVVSGRVQGVGFRFTTMIIAKELGLTGWVKNLSNGTVELEAQGEAMDVDILMKRLDNQRFIRIDNIEVAKREIVEESDFIIL